MTDAKVSIAEESATVPETPFCRELRSKQYFMLDAFAVSYTHLTLPTTPYV